MSSLPPDPLLFFGEVARIEQRLKTPGGWLDYANKTNNNSSPHKVLAVLPSLSEHVLYINSLYPHRSTPSSRYFDYPHLTGGKIKVDRG